MKCHICNKLIENNSEVEIYNKKSVHYECYFNRKQENSDFDELCKYVHRDIMNYAEHLKISKYLVMRLRGLHEGKFYANKNIQQQGSYTYKEILLTFKAKKIDILKSTQGKPFGDDQMKKINYIMAIVENHINEIVQRLQKIAETNKKGEDLVIENLKVDNVAEQKEIAEQKKEFVDMLKNKNKANKTKEMLNNLW